MHEPANTPAPSDGEHRLPPAHPEAVFAIPRSLAQATLDYLSMQPYREVYALVRGFESLEVLTPEAATRTERDDA